MAANDDLSAMLSSLMQDPQQMGQIMQMLSSLQGGTQSAPDQAAAPAPGPDPVHNAGPGGPDLSALFGMLSAMGSAGDDQGGAPGPNTGPEPGPASRAAGMHGETAHNGSRQNGPDPSASSAGGFPPGFDLNPEMLLQFYRMMSELNSQDDTYTALLQALRPFLGGSSLQALEQMLSIGKLLRIMRMFTPTPEPPPPPEPPSPDPQGA